jgi:hypothetical protein
LRDGRDERLKPNLLSRRGPNQKAPVGVSRLAIPRHCDDPKAAFRGQPAPGCPAAGINMAAHVTVTVWGKPHVVSIYQKSKNVWIAAGQYKDKQIQVTDSDYNSAIKRWRETATDRAK